LNKNLSQNQINTLLKYFSDKQFNEAEKYAIMLSEEFPVDPFIWKALGIIFKENGKISESISANKKSLKLNPNDAEVHNNLGFVYQEEKNYDEAKQWYEEAIRLEPNYIAAHHNLGSIYHLKKEYDKAEISFKKIIKIKPDYSPVYNNLGNSLVRQGKIIEAEDCYKQAIKFNKENPEAYNNLGIVLLRLDKIKEAVTASEQALTYKKDYPEAHYNLGLCFQKLGKFDEALKEYKKSIMIKPDYASVESSMLDLLKHMCDFNINDKLIQSSSRLGILTKPIQPFSLLSWEDNAEHHYLRSKNYIKENFKSIQNNILKKDQNLSSKLRVGFFSADFRDHAVMYLISGLFREYDKKKFEFFLYSFGKDESLKWHNLLKNNVDKFTDITNLAFQEISELSKKDNLDIAVDLMGYTKNNRLGIFKNRIAPTQINYLGYPGTIGAEYFDYIIADHILVPQDQKKFYSEKIIYMPNSYQPNDNEIIVPELNTTKSDHGLPKEGVVFCCFNQNYKIGINEFNIWMKILKKIDKSVLWLFNSNKWAKNNIFKQAELYNINSSRIIFANSLPHLEHIERQRHADIFLDTFNYNAHTTGSDALLAGLPIITKQGSQFAARVASSLLSALDLNELITYTDGEYEKLILNYASQPIKLREIKEKLKRNKNNKPLFNTQKYTRDFEFGLSKAHELYLNGEKPKDIIVNRFS
jgi:predicted O-linked N-acetylglucosamine transferase (SPINDLY family)